MTERPPDPIEELIWRVRKASLVRQGRRKEAAALRHNWLARRAGTTQDAADARHARLSFDLYHKVSDYAARYNATTGEQISWVFSALKDDRTRDMDPEACKAAAQQAANPPPDAELVQAEYIEQAGRPLFLARWHHRHDGLPVERDFIQVMVNGHTGKPFALHRVWHDIDEAPAER